METDLKLTDGRTLHVYDSGHVDGRDELTVFWHHGTPQLGLLPGPLLPAAQRLGIRFVSYDRPGYGGSSPQPGREVVSAAADVTAIADALGVGRFAVYGSSGGGTHSLVCGAALPDRVTGVVSISGVAPFDSAGLDWFGGMGSTGADELRAATKGREALGALLAGSDFDPEMFTPADHKALEGEWGWLGQSAAQAMAGGPDGMIDDDLAYVQPWGADPTTIQAPLLVVHGDEDRMVPCSHGEWLGKHCPTAEFWPSKGDGHISVLRRSEAALEWVAEQTRRAESKM